MENQQGVADGNLNSKSSWENFAVLCNHLTASHPDWYEVSLFLVNSCAGCYLNQSLDEEIFIEKRAKGRCKDKVWS